MSPADVDDLQRRLVAFVRAFGLHKGDETPCGVPIPVSEAHALTALADAGAGGLSQTDVGRTLGLTKSTVSRLVDQLVDRGWAARQAGRADGRVRAVVLTGEGAKVAAQVDRGAGPTGWARSSNASRPASAPRSSRRSRRWSRPPAMRDAARARAVSSVVVVAGLAVAVAVAAAAGGCGARGGDDGAIRQAEVAARGAHVMPFDLDATTHRFEPVDTGLVQTVVADNRRDTEQVALVREHLAHEAARFHAGDYGDPAAIHGDEMPGLAQLEAGAAAIAIAYQPTDAGGRITYAPTTPRWSTPCTAGRRPR